MVVKKNKSKKVLQEITPAPVRSGPAYMIGDLSSSQITVLRDKITEYRKYADQYYGGIPGYQEDRDQWELFSFLYVALCNQEDQIKDKIKERDEIREILKSYNKEA